VRTFVRLALLFVTAVGVAWGQAQLDSGGKPIVPGYPSARPAALVPKHSAEQHFGCNVTYALRKCQQDVAILKRAVTKYLSPVLGEWTWILVRSEDWKRITSPRRLDPNSPSFTFLAKKETYIEEALVVRVPGRERELMARWNMSSNTLLAFAITHEMGHGICQNASEAQANHVAALLRQGKPAWCLEPMAYVRSRVEGGHASHGRLASGRYRLRTVSGTVRG
jgi:hypothetical protein